MGGKCEEGNKIQAERLQELEQVIKEEERRRDRLQHRIEMAQMKRDMKSEMRQVQNKIAAKEVIKLNMENSVKWTAHDFDKY